MKYIILLLILFFSGCSLFIPYSWVGITEVTTIEDALLFMQDNIKYEKDNTEFWQFPEETYILGKGDCEDLAGLLAHLFIYNVNLDNVTLLIVARYSDLAGHMVVKVNDKIYEAYFEQDIEYFYKEFLVLYEIEYTDYISGAKVFHL